MKLHAIARLSVKGRELLIDRILTQSWSLAQAAEAAGVSDRTALSGSPGFAWRASRACWIAPRPQSALLLAPRRSESR
jgi:leucine-zipper of insertion element IS481